MKTKKKIMIWSDYACPFCYIGERRLQDAIRELGVGDMVAIEYRAFELDPNAPVKGREEGSTEERLAAKYGISLEEAKKRVEAIDRLGRDLGIDFKFGKVKSSNTFDAHRLLKFAQTNYEAPIVEALNESLFDAYFVKNESLSDRRLLLKLGEAAGLDATQANEVLNSDLYANDVRYDEREAHDRGVSGVPYLVFDGEFAVPGAVSTDDFKKALKEMLENKKDNNLNGNVCDSNGCKI